MIECSEPTIINQVADRLTTKYPTIPPHTVLAVVKCAHARFHGRPVRKYVPLLVQRYAEEELDQLRLAAYPQASEGTGERGDEAAELSSI